MEFNEELILRLAPGVKVVLHADRAEVTLGDRQLSGGAHTLAVLDAFARPVITSTALAALRPRASGTLDWMEILTTVVQLFEAGVLIDAAQPPAPKLREGGFGAHRVHIEMLNDRSRTSALIQSIRAAVRPSDIVVDIGTGTGVLAIAAAQAGARHVYAIEASDMAEAARDVIRANNLDHRITVIKDRSSRVTLPERADLLISEIFGNDPLGEHVLETFRDARKRLLNANARILPHAIRILGLPVTVPEELLARTRFTSATVANWQSVYGIDFSALADMPGGRLTHYPVLPQQVRHWPALSEPLLFRNVNLYETGSTVIDSRVEAAATREGEVSGVLVFFEADLGPGFKLTTKPAEAGKDNHWRVLVHLLPEPMWVVEGQRFAVRYRYGMQGNPGRAEVVATAPGGESASGTRPGEQRWRREPGAKA
jgi:SAM-dependent methyltransferase